jgi:hypothetical protein
MATRINILKLMQEIHGFARITHRRPQPRPPGLFLMEIRAHGSSGALPKRKLNIEVYAPEPSDLPHPVKINHIKESPLPVVVVPSHRSLCLDSGH